MPVMSASRQNGITLLPKGDDRRIDGRFARIPLLTNNYTEALAQTAKVDQALSLSFAGANYAIIVSKQHANKVRLALNPDAIVSDDDAEGSHKFKIHNICFDTSRQHLTAALRSLGWAGAQAVRTTGFDSWLIYANAQPPSNTMLLRSSTAHCKVIVTELKSTSQTWVPPVPTSIPGSATSSWAAPLVPPRPVAQKIDQVRGEIKDEIMNDIKTQLQSELAAVVEQKINASAAQFASAQADLATKLETAVVGIQTQMQTTAGIAQQAADVARQAIDTSTTLTSSLQAMMNAQQAAIMNQMKSLLDSEGNDRKTRRTDAADAMSQSRSSSPA